MTSNAIPNDNDVLFGRGFAINSHAGNQRLRSVAESYKPAFLEAKKKGKRAVARAVVDKIGRLDPPGRFLTEDPSGPRCEEVQGRWWLIAETDKAVEKVMHLLREKQRPTKKRAEGPDAKAQGEGKGTKTNVANSRPSSAENATTEAQSVQRSIENIEHQYFPQPQSTSPIVHVGTDEGHTVQAVENRQYMKQSADNQHVTDQLASEQHAADHVSAPQNIGSPFGPPNGTSALLPESQSPSHQQNMLPGSQGPGYQQNMLSGSQGPNYQQNMLPESQSPGYQQNMLPESQSPPQNMLPESQIAQSMYQNHRMQRAEAGPQTMGRNSEASPALYAQNAGPKSNYFDVRVSSHSFGLPDPNVHSSAPMPGRTVSAAVGRTSIESTRRNNPVFAEGDDEFDSWIDSVFDDPVPDQSARPTKSQHRSRALTLRQWIDESSRRLGMVTSGGSGSTEGILPYVESAVPVALGLTEFILEADHGTNPIPLASMVSDNVIVYVSFQDMDEDAKSIDRVEIVRRTDDAAGVGGNMPRLFALGAILYEVFSRRPFAHEGGPSSATASPTVGRLTLTDETMEHNADRPSKRSQRGSSRPQDGDVYRESATHLEMLGVPRSVRDLVGNLLDCSNGDFRGDDAYRSLADVSTDLKLMRDDPARFLRDLRFGADPSFKIGPKFYGREDDVSKIEDAYLRHRAGECGGMLVSGGAGVGKSSLVSGIARKLTMERGHYFLEAKFDQNKSVNPLNTVRATFNALCDSFARDATSFQLSNVATSLECALGSQAALLAGILPNLTKLTSCSADGTSTECIDVVASMQFLFGKLLDILSHHKGVTFFLDDLQWADPTSLMLIRSMMSSTKESGNVFFACCFRDDDMNEGDPFTEWLASINTFPLIHLQNISKEGVNELVSETLHLFPRITRPLASILHHKTRGNPLFLKQLLELLKDQGCIRFSVSLLRWTWDMEKIMSIDISDDVLALMMKEMQRLAADVQFGLHVASCLGSSVKYSLCDILSQDLGVNLRSLLDQAVQTGFIVKVDETCIRFSHDKIQQAAYEMMPVQERLASHMRFGLAICSHSLDSEGDDDRFFAAINQINRGGANVLQDTNQKVMIAALNLKAGRRSMELSDFCTALQLFEHGMSFLDHSEHWVFHYSLSLDIFDGAVEVACHLNNTASVRKISAEVFTHAKCDDDRLKCLYAVIKSLRVSFNLVEAKKAAFEMLDVLGERVPRPSDDKRLAADLEAMKFVLDGTSDESIMNSKEADQTWKVVLSLNLYHDLFFLFHYLEPMRIADISLRMVQITLSKGLCCMSPVAFAQFSVVLVTEDAELAYRVSKLALRLLDRADARRYTGAVIALVATGVSWVKEPLQSIPESHLVGYHHGQRGGDVWSSTVNYLLYLQIIYLSGQSLSHVRKKIWVFALELLERKQQFMFYGMRVLYLQILALIEGLDFKEEEDAQHALPSWENSLKSGAGKNLDMLLVFSTHQLMRSFLFKQYDNLPEAEILNHITGSSVPLRPIFYYGILFEALISFHLMRQTDREEYQKKGEAALVFMRKWSKCNEWNFECKYLLLEAEMMYSSGYHEQAEQLYRQSILSANGHKFVHIEAIACEAAAIFYCHRGLQQKAHSFFARSVQCYKKWGALAVAGRVEKEMIKRFDTGLMQGGHLDVPSQSSSQMRASKRYAN